MERTSYAYIRPHVCAYTRNAYKKTPCLLWQENDTAEKAMQFGLKELQRTLLFNIKIMKKI